MNVNNQILMGIHAGHVPDKDTLKLVLEQFNPTVIGMAVQNIYTPEDSTDKIPDLAIVREDAANLNLDTLVDFFGKCKEWPATAYFGKLEGEKATTDIQPICVLDGNGQPFMSIFLEGTLIGNDEPMTHTEQFNYVNGILIPKINEWISDFADSEDVLEKVLNKLKKGSLFDKEFLKNDVGHRAVLQIMPVEGDIIALGRNDLHADFTWGWMSQRLVAKAAAAPVKEAVVAAVTKAANRFGFSKPATAASVPASPPPVPGPSDVKDAATAGSEDRYPAKPATGSPELAARPPHWAKTNDDVKLWYKIVGNAPSGELKSVVPSAFKKRLPIGVLNKEAVEINNLEAFKTYALKRTLMTSGQTSAGKPPAEAVAAAAVIAETAGAPIIGAKTMEKVLDFITKNVDTSSKEIVAPKEIQDMERDLPKFSEEVGLSYDEIRNWPANALAKIGQIDVWALVIYAIECRARERAATTGQPVAGKKETGKSVTTTTVTGNTTKQESVSKEVHVASKEILKPTGSRFGFKKAA